MGFNFIHNGPYCNALMVFLIKLVDPILFTLLMLNSLCITFFFIWPFVLVMMWWQFFKFFLVSFFAWWSFFCFYHSSLGLAINVSLSLSKFRFNSRTYKWLVIILRLTHYSWRVSKFQQHKYEDIYSCYRRIVSCQEIVIFYLTLSFFIPKKKR